MSVYFFDLRFLAMVFLGAVAGLFVGAIPGLSVSMATALLVSITYTWETSDALAMVMGVYMVGVYSGAISAILVNIPGAPSSVVTTLDGYPMAKRGEARRALVFAAFYSFVGGVLGLLALRLMAGPISEVALSFAPMDYFLLAVLGLTAVGSLSAGSMAKALVSAGLGLLTAMVGMDSVMGTPRLTFGLRELQGGVNVVPALVGLFGFSEILWVLSQGKGETLPTEMRKERVRLGELLRHFGSSLFYGVVGTVVGALPGAGGPVASFLAYSEARRWTKHPSHPFGEGAEEGLVASETANNACVGGALIPLLTLAVPGDAVTAILLSVFHVHGLRPGPLFLRETPQYFDAIIAAGFLACGFLLLFGLTVAPRLSRILTLPKEVLLPVVAVLCVIGSFACNNRLFDVWLMLFFGLLGFWMRRRGYPLAPMTLAMVLGGMMDSNFRRAISLAASEEHWLPALFGRPITLLLLAVTGLLLFSAFWKRKKV